MRLVREKNIDKPVMLGTSFGGIERWPCISVQVVRMWIQTTALSPTSTRYNPKLLRHIQQLEIMSAIKRKRSDSDVSVSFVPGNITIQPVYRQPLPNPPEGIVFLFSTRFSEALKDPALQATLLYDVTAEQVIEELRRLLAIKTLMEDHKADKISSTSLMDAMWHAAILDTQFYADLQPCWDVPSTELSGE